MVIASGSQVPDQAGRPGGRSHDDIAHHCLPSIRAATEHVRRQTASHLLDGLDVSLVVVHTRTGRGLRELLFLAT